MRLALMGLGFFGSTTVPVTVPSVSTVRANVPDSDQPADGPWRTTATKLGNMQVVAALVMSRGPPKPPAADSEPINITTPTRRVALALEVVNLNIGYS
jgi:hypothetical protein